MAGKNGPNKAVAAARRRMGGFPNREPNPARDPNNDPFMAFVFGKAREGVMFSSMDEAREAFEKESQA